MNKPNYPVPGTGKPPKGVSRMLREYDRQGKAQQRERLERLLDRELQDQLDELYGEAA